MQPEEFYLEKQEKYNDELTSLKAKLSMSSMARLAVFVLTILGIYGSLTNVLLLSIIAIVGVSLFIYLLVRHTKLQFEKNKFQRLVEINTTELYVLKGQYHQLDKGEEFKDHAHFYSYDIDLFGNGSFFQYINRTATVEGKRALAHFLTTNDTKHIDDKQEAAKELSQKSDWRQLFTALAGMVKVDQPAAMIINWMHTYRAIIPKSMNWLPKVFSLISVGIVILVILGQLNFQYVVVWFFMGLGITGAQLKKVNKLYDNTSKATATFKQYYQLLQMIEEEAFVSKILKTKQEAIQLEKEKASTIFLRFSKLLDAFDQRNNMMIGAVANGLLLRDLAMSHKIEQWIDTYHQKVGDWFDVIAFFDAENSLANVIFNHPTFTFPVLTDSDTVLQATALGHPLIADDHRITNDFVIKDHQFFIITGANMAGKSTFLRTVSLGMVMANAGLPVCASNFTYKPIKLITSMRTTDSLTDDESYFFSELKRLKFIVDQIKIEHYFIILDEILKGTNSTDKAIGSKKFVEKLVASQSTGIIATHDLSLCEIEKELEEVKNYYFDAEITNNELYFDYKLKTGVCKNMNASFLLKKMEIV